MITKAIEIINDGLSASLNMEDGGSIAVNLKALYDYVVSRLLHAHVNNDAYAISEAEELLGEILTAWREISPAKNPQRQADEQLRR
jgi:flagellar protein FliS